MKRITGVGYSIPSQDDDLIRLDSLSSLSETEIAIFSPDLSGTSYSAYENGFYSSKRLEYEGKMLYNKESSAKMLEHSKHWKSELLNFVENGGTLVVILCKKEEYIIYTGTKDVSGTGRNQKVTNHVTPFTNYNFLPFASIDFHSASGKTVLPKNPLVIDLHKHFKDYFTFETYIKSDKLSVITFTTKNKDRILGSSFKLKLGYVHFIPNLNLEIDKFISYDNKTNKRNWNDEAIKTGKILVNCFIEIDSSLRKAQEKTPKPNWINTEIYQLKDSEKTLEIIAKNDKEIEKREKENSNLEKVLEEQESLKDLLYETGKPLENAVIKALRILGYKAENYNDGELELDQIIISPEGHRLIGECEGKESKDIDVSKFRQLLDSLNADFEKEEVKEKAYGLLFGNPQRLINPEERILSFTKKCQDGAKRENIGLIKTEDLFKVCKYISENSDVDFAAKCRKAIIDQLGEIVKFPNTDGIELTGL